MPFRTAYYDEMKYYTAMFLYCLLIAHKDQTTVEINHILKQYPPKFTAFWLAYGTEKRNRILAWPIHPPEKPYAPYGSPIEDILRDHQVQIKIREIWEALAKSDIASTAYANVATRGGELRAKHYVLPPEAAEYITSVIRDQNIEIQQHLEDYLAYRALLEYGRRESMNRQEFIALLQELSIPEEKVKQVVQTLYKLGLTTRYTDLSIAPFLIKDPEKYQEYLKAKITEAVQEVKNTILPPKPSREAKHTTPPKPIYVGSEREPSQWGILGKSNGTIVKADLSTPHIVFVCGKMGAGKGYTIGVICEMLASNTIPKLSKIHEKTTLVILHYPREDTRSEFWSITQPNDNPQEVKALQEEYSTEPQQLIPPENLRVFIDPVAYERALSKFQEEYSTRNVHPIKIDPATLTGRDWATILATAQKEEPLYVKRIFDIIESLQKPTTEEITQKITQDPYLTAAQKKLALLRLNLVKRYLTPQQDIAQNLAIGGVNIFDLRETIKQPDDIFTVMTLIISTLQNRKELQQKPLAFIINEAHTYLNPKTSTQFIQEVEYLIRRKRHGNNWLILDTHIPQDIHPQIITLSDIKIIHQLDKALQSPVIEKLTKEAERKPYQLKTGEAIIIADKTSKGPYKPITIQIRPRITKHGAPTKTA